MKILFDLIEDLLYNSLKKIEIGGILLFKSAFSKYMTAFIIIVLLSFLMLSSIITALIRRYVGDETETDLAQTSIVLANEISKLAPEELEIYLKTPVFPNAINPLINKDRSLNIVVVDESGYVLLSTIGTENDSYRKPCDFAEGLRIDIASFTQKTAESSHSYLCHRGRLGDLIQNNSLVCAKEIITKGACRGYVLAITANSDENSLINLTHRAVLTSSAWVMIAAVVAVYFITERLMHPLRNMTSAAKKFAKGDFSSRIAVAGEDEVAELADAFNNMAESLEKLEKMRSSFLASVSHDLRTPMTTISGFIEGITSGAIPPEKHDYYLGVISAEVHRLSRLVSQLLDISRLESGDRKFNFIDFDVAEMARIILISFEQKIDDKKLEVEFLAEEDEMCVYADKDAIYQVLYNLCHNAIKFSREKGTFRIRIRRIENKKIAISVFNEGETISKEDANLVFERFYKTDKSRGLDKSGVGLGLFISKTIVDAHGEVIYVESEESVGTEFTFTLKEGESAKKKSL